MVCPYCGNESQVYNSRAREQGQVVWRRRHCATCGASWTTHEQVVDETTYRVAKNGKVTRFERETLFCSLYECLKHRKKAPTEANQLTNTVITKLRLKRQPIIETSAIKAAAEQTLTAFDPLAGQLYLRIYPTSLEK
jgi:transcriptional repressor NrdR